MPVTQILSLRLPMVESKARPRQIAAHSNRILPISIQSVYSFHIIVPVVQRIEQGFPNAKTPFLLESAYVISGEQVTLVKRVE
jgi:hypothetical protein